MDEVQQLKDELAILKAARAKDHEFIDHLLKALSEAAEIVDEFQGKDLSCQPGFNAEINTWRSLILCTKPPE